MGDCPYELRNQNINSQQEDKKQMITQTATEIQSLYDQDYYLWLEATVTQLKTNQLSSLDLENLITELEDMGKSYKRALESYLTRFFEHCFKLLYWELEREYNAKHWYLEIANFRREIKKLLRDSPSLKPYLAQVFTECYLDARKAFAKTLNKKPADFPNEIATLEQILDDDWFPSNNS
jgi:RecB family exonuclease